MVMESSVLPIQWDRGSKASRKASPMKLMLSTVRKMSRPGKKPRHQWPSRTTGTCASCSMRPQVASGGWKPRPRKDRVDSARMATATFRVADTTTGPSAFGTRCMNTMRLCPAPSTRAVNSDRLVGEIIRTLKRIESWGYRPGDIFETWLLYLEATAEALPRIPRRQGKLDLADISRQKLAEQIEPILRVQATTAEMDDENLSNYVTGTAILVHAVCSRPNFDYLGAIYSLYAAVSSSSRFPTPAR